MSSNITESGVDQPGPGGDGYPNTVSETSLVPGAGGDDYPHNTAKISDFAKHTRELGHYINRQVLDRANSPVDPDDREAMIQWTMEAKNHSVDPDGLDPDYLMSDRPLDYHMLSVIYQQHSDLVKDVD